jgi:hypothetical protein
MKMPVSVRIFLSFVAPVPGMKVRKKKYGKHGGGGF